MAIIFNFPGSKERFSEQIEAALEEAHPPISAAAKGRILETLTRFPGLPDIAVSVPLPGSIPESVVAEFLAVLGPALQKEYNEKVSKVILQLVGEICKLQVKLSQYEDAPPG